MSHFAQLLEKNEVPLLELWRILVLRGPREAKASCSVGHHVTLHQQLIVCNKRPCHFQQHLGEITSVLEWCMVVFPWHTWLHSCSYLVWRDCWDLGLLFWRRAGVKAHSPYSCLSDWPALSIWEPAAGVCPHRTSFSTEQERTKLLWKEDMFLKV